MEPITSLLDAFIKLAERIANLEKNKLQDKQSLFNGIVKPLFDELEPAASNYMDFFRRSKQAVTNSAQEDLHKLADKIKEERDAMIMARIKVREMANQLKEQVNDEEIADFAISVTNFFYKAPRFPKVGLRFQSSAMRFLDFLHYAASHNIDKQEIINHIDVILSSIEKSWGLVVQAYEKVKIHSTSSPKFLHKSPQKRVKSR